MKIIVDCLPEHPSDCLFAKLESEIVYPHRYFCKVNNELCAYHHSGWKNECPFLKAFEKADDSENAPLNNSTHEDRHDEEFKYAEYEERMRKMDTKELLQDICVVGGRAYDIIKKILEERGAI